MEAIIESVDEFYSKNLAQDVTRGMRDRRVKVNDGVKERRRWV